MTESDYQNRYEDIVFKGKKPEEDVILLLRRHWLVFVFRFLPFILLIIGFLFLHITGPSILIFLNLRIDTNWFYLVESFLFLFLWFAIFIVWINYYLDVWIVTNIRIVNIEQKALFSRYVSELKHHKIQDVTSEIKGVIPTLFGYGYVFIQTAGERQRFVFKQISDPNKTRNIIMKLQKHAVWKAKKKEGEIFRGKA